MYGQFLFVFVIICSIFLTPLFSDISFAQQESSPHHQWQKSADPDTLTCKENYLLLQKNNGNPACVKSSTYLKLIDRGYGDYDSSIMTKRPEMMTQLMHHMISDEKLMHHWHDMMQKNPPVLLETMLILVSQIKDNPELLKNLLGPITSDSKLRDQMIQIMKNHPQMENSLKQHSGWMDSVHRPMINFEMVQDMSNYLCSWCPAYQMNPNHLDDFTTSDKMMEIMHKIWINSGMSSDMHRLMIENPTHMAQMSEYLMKPMLYAVMDDVDLRSQMIDLMLEHDDFMNTIRHVNPSSEH